MWELDYKESWVLKNWCFWTVLLEKTLESLLGCKEIQPVHPKGDQSWIVEGLMLKLKLQYFGHLVPKTDSFEKTLMLGKTEGGRSMGNFFQYLIRKTYNGKKSEKEGKEICLQSSPTSGPFPMSQFFTSGGQSIEVSASASVLPMNIQDWFPLGFTGWISLQSKGLSRVFSNTTVQKHQFFSTQLSL